MSGTWASSLLALFAAASLVFGSAIPSLPALRSRLFERRLSVLIGFSAGLMLATALHELVPEALELNRPYAMWGVSLGFFTLYVAERLTHFHACRHRQCEVQEDDVPPGGTPHNQHILPEAGAHAHVHHEHVDRMALVGMSIHNFADGLTTAAAFAVSRPVGVVVVLAIVLHQAAAGLSLGAIMLRAGRSHRHILWATSLVASFILLGALFYHFAIPVGPAGQGIVLGIAGGSFFYVAACDLLPEAHAEDEGWNVTAMTLAGYVFALLVKTAFEAP